jgi:hypothetical protein
LGFGAQIGGVRNLFSALKALLVLFALVAFVFRDQVFFLQGFEGRVTRSWYELVHNASTGSRESTPMVEVLTAQGALQVEVPQAVYNQAKVGTWMAKKRFTTRVTVSR